MAATMQRHPRPERAMISAMEERRARPWIDRVSPWIDWPIAVVVAIVVFNVNVTAAGDPLSGNGGAAFEGEPGISESARVSFYVAITIAAAVMSGSALAVAAVATLHLEHVLAAFRAFGLLASAGMAGLLLDYLDGPVRTVQLVVYLAVALSVLRFARLALALSGGPLR